MKRKCIRVQGQISAGCVDDAAQEHLEECPSCALFQSKLQEVDDLFGQLPEYQVPDHVSSVILGSIARQSNSQGVWGWKKGFQFVLGFIVVSELILFSVSTLRYMRWFVILVFTYLLYLRVRHFRYFGPRLAGPVLVGSLAIMVVAHQGVSFMSSPVAIDHGLQMPSYSARVLGSEMESKKMDSDKVYNDLREYPMEEVADEYFPSVSPKQPARQKGQRFELEQKLGFGLGDMAQSPRSVYAQSPRSVSQAELSALPSPEGLERDHYSKEGVESDVLRKAKVLAKDQLDGVFPSGSHGPLSNELLDESIAPGVFQEGSSTGDFEETPSYLSAAQSFVMPRVSRGVERRSLGRKQRFVATQDSVTLPNIYEGERGRVTGLSFLEPRGYWSNTYVPGDRKLRQSLQAIDGWLGNLSGSALEPLRSLYDDVRRMEQPLDAPLDGALSLNLQTDSSYAEGVRRLFLQVSIGAAERAKGYRAPMNVALLLDVDGLSQDHEVIKGYREILRGLSSLREAGDNFSVVLTGRSGGIAVSSADFRHGTVQVLSDNLGKAKEAGAESRVFSLAEALEAASNEVSKSGVNALGRSLIVVATHRQGLASVDELVGLAHRLAAEGMVVSTLSLDGASLPSLEAIALAGQGNRRVFTVKHDARELWKEELASVSRVVARALRLKIKLAPGVKLVEVLGARPLNFSQIAQVKRVEKKIDQMISQEFGIEEDRGDDQDGIQILIPAFYSGDAHVVLLDVVVDGPGAVAEAELKYKDLVDLSNATLRTSVAIGSSPVEPSPLNLNVVKNYFANLFSQTMKEVSLDIVTDPSCENALSKLALLEQQLSSMQASFGQLRGDAELELDRRVVARLSSILRMKTEVLRNQRLLQLYLYVLSQLKLLPRPELEPVK